MTSTCYKILTVAVCLLFSYGTGAESETEPRAPNFYSFSADDIHGNIVFLEKYKGKVSLVVNVASRCGYTDNHYKDLVLLQNTFGHTDRFNVLAFPCNQFGQQEPGTNKDVYDFASNRMGSNFPLFSKINVIRSHVHPAWLFLTESSGKVPTWNFFKYLVDHTGQVINAWGPDTDPEELRGVIQQAILAIGAGNLSGEDYHSRDEF